MVESVARVDHHALKQFVFSVFHAAGLDEERAAIVARHLVLANLRGIDSHGVTRVAIYTKRMEHGLVSIKPSMSVAKETPSGALIDGGNELGILAATKGIQLAVAKAKEAGVAVVGVKNSNHCGMLADYTQFAAAHDCIALAATNAPSNMAPWGGREKYFGTNPLSYGIPAGEEQDIIFDMATSVVARGKITLAQKNNQKIPVGWAINKKGEPTTDPDEALEGLVLPVGGPKGYGLALLADVLSGLFTGAAFGPYIGSLYRDMDRPQNVGQFFFVMRADLFEPLDVFKNRVDQMIREIKAVPLASGYEKIYLPGEIESETMREREAHGIPLTMKVINELKEVGRKYRVNPPF